MPTMTDVSKMFALGALCALLGCGDDYNPDAKNTNNATNNSNPIFNNSPNNPNPGGAADVQAFNDDVFKLVQQGLCKQVFGCPQAAEPGLMQFLGRYPSEAACQSAPEIKALFGAFSFGQGDSVAAGRQSFNKANAQACLSKLRAALAPAGACDIAGIGALDGFAECDALFVGLVQTGGACQDSSDCASASTTCVIGADSCEGTCQAESSSFDCEETCAADEFCDYSSGAPACVARRSVGEPCEDDEGCAAGAVCDGPGFEQGVCVAAGSVGAGQPCDADGVCASGLRCTDEGVCGANMLASSGGACDVRGQTLCRPGSVCAIQISGGVPSGTCGAPKPSGSACYTPLECQPGLTCVTAQQGMQGQCGPTKKIGQPCANDFDCETLRCGEDDVCIALDADEDEDEACVSADGP